MNSVNIIWNILEYVLYIYFGIATIYIFVFAVASLFNYKVKEVGHKKIREVAVLIPAFKEDAVIVDVAREALKQNYPDNEFSIIVIADSLKEQTLRELKELPVILIKIKLKKRTKAKAIYKALTKLDRHYDIAIILDADNIMGGDFIKKINNAFSNGYRAVQGHRVAKNQNTHIAVLDAISEEINNSIFRKGHRILGISSALIGSGMAFEFDTFKEYMRNATAIGGFDKELEFNLLKDRVKIEYLPEAIVMDEKVQKTKVFINQRRRWLSSQLIFLVRYFPMAVHELFRGNFDIFDKLYQMSSPPRLILLGFVFILSVFYGVLQVFSPGNEWFVLTFTQWLILLILILSAFLFSIPVRLYSRKMLRAILSIPKVFMLMLIAFFTMKGARDKFIHTEHGKNNGNIG